MAKKKPFKDMSDQEVANAFTHYGANAQHAVVFEMFCVAARLITKLEQVDPAELDRATTPDRAAAFLHRSLKEVLQAAGMRELLAGTVKRYAFKTPFNEDDFDPDGSRSVAVAELILRNAAAYNQDRED